ncbi:MAG: ABC transporter ATP-binding protein/permease, partial [Clostridia bacterium]|nr:ABC transporter ATP-binding protein/permease [Clostridia bacterium]
MNKGGFGPGNAMLGNPRQQNNPNGQKNSGKLDPRTRRKVLVRLSKYLFRYYWIVIPAVILMLASNILGVLAPKISGKAIDVISPTDKGESSETAVAPSAGEGGEAGADNIGNPDGSADSSGNTALKNDKIDFDKLGYYIVLMLVCYLGSAVLSLALAITLAQLGKKITFSLRKDLFEHLMTLPVEYFDRHQTGDIISHISYDVDTVNTSLSHDLLQICSSVVTVFGCLWFMVGISPLLLIVFCITVPISVYSTKLRTTLVRPLFRMRSAKLGELNGYAEEMLSGQKTVRAYGRTPVISERFDKKNHEACEAYYKADWHGAVIGPMVMFINNMSLSLIILFGGIFYMLSLTGMVLTGSVFFIALGDLSAFIQYSRKFSGPINEFANILADLQSALAAAERIFAIMDEVPEKADAEDAAVLENPRGEVCIDHVAFGYVKDRTIIHDLSLNVPEGSTIAIVGPTGAGKTTVINLLMRFYDVDSGSIVIDGHEIRGITRDSLRSAYTMVLQETWLFGGTVAENIAYGRIGATMEEIVAAAKAAHIDGFIRSLPNGYDTVLTDNGVSISKGQKQLITIARAMLADSPMLILDEATSNVDS